MSCVDLNCEKPAFMGVNASGKCIGINVTPAYKCCTNKSTVCLNSVTGVCMDLSTYTNNAYCIANGSCISIDLTSAISGYIGISTKMGCLLDS